MLLAALCLLLPQDPPAAVAFRYRAGDVHVLVERTLQRETDQKLGFALATSTATERRCTVLEIASDGSAEVLVEERTGPQELHEYVENGHDAREAYRKKGFRPDATVRQRVLLAHWTADRCRCEPARDEPAVFYLQELGELPAWALALPADGAAEFHVRPDLPRLAADFVLHRRGDVVEGPLTLAIHDGRVQDGANVPCPDGDLRWVLDPADGLPRQWRLAVRYPRFPIARPNETVLTGERFASAPLDTAALAGLRADHAAYSAVHEAFFAGRFPQALDLAAGFARERPGSRLAAAVAADVAAFREQVPHYGQTPPALPVQVWCGGEPVSLEALRGRVVVLDFWATWCVPCVAGMAHLLDLHDREAAHGLSVLGLTRVDKKQSADDVRAFAGGGYAAAHGGRAFTYPLAVLGTDAVHDFFAVKAIPKLVVLGRDGTVRWEQTGGGGEARVDRIVAAALAEPAPK